MADEATNEEVQSDSDGFEPITSQEHLDRVLAKRLERERAKFADYDDLKVKADQFDQLDQTSKTAADDAAASLQTEKDRADLAQRELLRLQVAVEKAVPASAIKFLTGDTREDIEASAQDVLNLMGESSKPRPPRPDPNQGRSGEGAASTAQQFESAVRGLLH